MDNFWQKFNKFLFIVIVGLLFFNSAALAKHKHHKHLHQSKTHTAHNRSVSLPPKQAIENIINRYGNDDVGVLVTSMNNGQVVYERNANKLFMPASTLKTFTAATALTYFGANYKFQTKVFSKNNDFYFYFDGDPTLTVNNLSSLVSALDRAGIKVINGNVYLDDTLFDQVGYGPGWFIDDRNFCYSSPVAAVSLNRNCFPFTIYAPRYVNGRVSGEADGFYDFIKVYSSAVGQYSSDCILSLHGLENNDYQIDGCTKPNGRRISFLVTAKNMRLFAANVLIKLLQEHNIQLYGQVKFAPVPNDATLMATHESMPLNSILKTMLKKSDNLYANTIYKKLGAVLYGKPGTWQSGAKAIAYILNKNNAGIEFNRIRIVDGSGLSRENVITPHSLVALLNYVYHNPNIRDNFIHDLGISGVDGHLQYRMESLGSRVHAKTGTERGITSLAGYIYAKSGRVYAFAIMVNGFNTSVRVFQNLEDEICRYFVFH